MRVGDRGEIFVHQRRELSAHRGRRSDAEKEGAGEAGIDQFAGQQPLGVGVALVGDRAGLERDDVSGRGAHVHEAARRRRDAPPVPRSHASWRRRRPSSGWRPRRRRRNPPARHRSGFHAGNRSAISLSSAATPASREGKMSDSSPVMVKALRSAPRIDRFQLAKTRLKLVEALPQRRGDGRAATMRPFSTRVTFRCAPPTSKPATICFPFSKLQAFIERVDSCGKSVAYHSCSRLERRRGGPR